MQPNRPKTTGHVFKKINKDSGPSRLANKIRDNSEQRPMRAAQTLGRMVHDFKMTFVVTCQDCKQETRVDPLALVESHGAETPLGDVRVVCAACGSDHTHLHPVSN